VNRLLLTAIFIFCLIGCTSEVKRTATNEEFVSPSSPPLQLEFQEFSYQGVDTSLSECNPGLKSRETYLWVDENSSRQIEITIQTLKAGWERRRQIEEGQEWWFLCSGTSEISHDKYETVIDLHPAPTIATPKPVATHIYKKYTLYLGSRKYIVLVYQEKLSLEQSHTFTTWKAEKRDSLKRGDSAVADHLEKKRQELPFKAILAFEQRADGIMKATHTEHFVPNGAYY